MGGDFGPRSIVQACVASLSATPSLHLTLVGQPSLLEELIASHPAVDRARLSIVPASETITMDEKPAAALRGKPDSSMRVALELLRDGKVQACVSAGNTGALMALSRHVLKTLPGIDRPAMVAAIPTQTGYCQLLDLGANVDCSAEHLFQFAVMGSVAAQALGVARPRVALLNIGTEDIKGNQQVKLAATLLQGARGLNYIGFVEGDGLYRGEADVVVCDGFVGNILLKSSEGLATMIATRIESLFRQSLVSRLVGALALPLMRRLQADLAPARHNGASFLGLQGIVVKSHGSAGVEGFQSAIARAVIELQENLPQRLHGRLEDLLP
ncbi:phosphate acyltransferase PlsX [Pseudomonas rhodesiae]|uniref:Phosphate acyltransferase n=2 Tax=Pseudomonas TaxID=286 RepID=A0AAE8HAC0_9PSED|nr:phosphate acyltransferase PlsX [Pseudomonas rhodesiae]ROM60338.1 phosphate acyltransferase [Pseudomonas rhodesiae]ROM68140.1 phosphate acyltransferase [Pseudomonas rhodesiae]WLI32226.1 phosphate acyltransferase PlsX [Pseudomonas rhodesiae]SDU92922.1 phosphate:acyl-[acyl carrier protein] acyltransferase [Pseudomonas rhodesiae]